MERRRRHRGRPGTPAPPPAPSPPPDPAVPHIPDAPQARPRRVRSRDTRRRGAAASASAAAAAAAAVEEHQQQLRAARADPRRRDDRPHLDPRRADAPSSPVLSDPPPGAATDLPHSALPYPDFIDEFEHDPDDHLPPADLALHPASFPYPADTITPAADDPDDDAPDSAVLMLQHGPSVSFPLGASPHPTRARSSSSGSGGSAGSGGSGSPESRDAAAAHDSNGALSTSSGPSPESSANRLTAALAVRMPDRPRSPLVGRPRMGGPASPSALASPVTHSPPRAKEEPVLEYTVPQPSGPPIAPAPPPAPLPVPRAAAVQIEIEPVEIEPQEIEPQVRPARYTHAPQILAQQQQPPPAPLAPQQQPTQHPGRAGSPMRKFGVRAERGSAAAASPRKGARTRARRGATAREDPASALRQHAQMQHELAQQRPEEDAAPRRHQPSIRLARDVATINEALRESRASVDKAETVLMALAKFAIAPKNPHVIAERRDALIEAGSIDLMVEVQTCHAASAPVQAIAAWAIGSMCHEDPAMQVAFGRAKGVEAVVGSIRNHDASLWVIELGLRALSALTWEPVNRETIGMCGGLEVVISTMGRHADMCTVQADGATLLANSAYGHEQNKVLLANSFGLDAIVTAMRGFTHDATMQNHGCLAIRNLTWGLDRNKEIAGVKGGVNAVIDALDTHIGDAAVVEQGAAALCIMVEKVPSNIERMLNSSDWIAVLLNTLQSYPDTETVQVNLLTVLAEAVAAHSDKVPALITAGALDVALAGMRRNITRRAVMHAGAHAARALLATGAPEAEAALRGAGGIGTLLDMLYCSVTAPPPAVPAAGGVPLDVRRLRGAAADTAGRAPGTREAERTRRVSPGRGGGGPGPGTSAGQRDRNAVRAVAAPQNRAVPWV